LFLNFYLLTIIIYVRTKETPIIIYLHESYIKQ